MSSPTLHTFGLEAAIEEMLDQFADEYELACRFRAPDKKISLEKKIELLLYRSAKELLQNIVKHAKAHHVRIDIDIENEFIVLKVVDDGKGFDTNTLNVNHQNSFGLFSIRQRLTNVGGYFVIESEKKLGTTIILRAPLKKQIHEEKNDY